MLGKRHKFGLSLEALPTSYSGWYYALKMPLAREFDNALAWLLDSGMYKVTNFMFHVVTMVITKYCIKNLNRHFFAPTFGT